jgi:hypothetical protein
MGAISIPIDELITHIQAVEATFASEAPREILTRIRCLYYNSAAFVAEIPEATIHVMDSIKGAPVATTTRLKERADENGSGDNPSPYFVSGTDEIDFGHVVLGLEALLGTNTDPPFTVYGVPRVDPASWVADLAIACVWDRDTTSSKTMDAADAKTIDANAKRLASGTPPEPEPFFVCSAPRQDLLGDVDFFGLHVEWDGTKKLSEVFRSYYKGPGVGARWTRFRSHPANTWASLGGATPPVVEDRVNRMGQLFSDGKLGTFGNTVASLQSSVAKWALSPFGAGHSIKTSPNPIKFPKTPAYIARFNAWVSKSGAGNP